MNQPRPTALQQAQQAFRDTLMDARDRLDERSYRLFVDFICRVVAVEAARCTAWERRHEDETA